MHERFMRRALELAQLGRGQVSPNPMVGCVIVHDERIIGEGWHERYGHAHAERNAIGNVAPADEPLLRSADVYVTLEPCAHWGKQPPCAELLVEKQVGRVICCNADPNPLVAGRGFQKLRDAGIEVVENVLADEGRALNARFFTFIEKKRPYIVLKWAETADGFIGAPGAQPVQISGPLAQRLVHRWRSEEDAILVGTTTALNDNPRLNVRLWPNPTGKQPLRIVFDRNATLPVTLHLFDGSQPTLVLHERSDAEISEILNVEHSFTPPGGPDSLFRSFAILYARNIASVLVEGGAATLQRFIDAGLWDEARVFRSAKTLGAGVLAPRLPDAVVLRENVGEDELLWVRP